MSSKQAAMRMTADLFLAVLRSLQKNSEEIEKELQVLVGDTRTLRGRLRYLKNKGYVEKSNAGYRLTAKGKYSLAEHEVWNLEIPIPKKWDGKWRLVLFDIPKDKRRRRDIFRLRLKDLGLVLYQDSVWVYPFPLEQTVRLAADFYHLSGCVSFAVAERLTGERHLQSRFGLSD